MADVQQDLRSPGLNRLGGTLVALALGAVVVAYPPRATGLEPLFGVGTMFLPLLVSVGALLSAIGGSVLLARNIATDQTERSQRLAIRVLVSACIVAGISAYLAVVAGFGLQTALIIGPVVIAVVISVGDEFAH